MKHLLSFIFVLIVTSAIAQNKFCKLSRPEKIWVLTHPFVAKKSFRITKQILVVVDSIKKTRIIGTDGNGGQLDAFRHAYWMASLAGKIGERRSLKLGIAHEKGNYIQFKKHKLEDAILPDSISCAMDLFNNKQGGLIGLENKNKSCVEIQKSVQNALMKGDLKIIKKDEYLNYLNCDGDVIDLKRWNGKWNIPKCLITSNIN
jgi:hypothetical protein